MPNPDKLYPYKAPMRTSLFVFLGITETGSDADINLLKSRLEMVLEEHIQPIQIELMEDLLTLNIANPDLNIYISFVSKNDRATFLEWKELARNFELPWDIKPVDKQRLGHIYSHLQEDGWYEYMPFRELAFTILNEIQRFNRLKVYTIPSMAISPQKDKIFNKTDRD
jgi:hypothetical protein